MAGLLGKNYTAQIDIAATLTDVACQGDLTFQTGKTLEISRTKNCKHPFFREAGYTAQFTVELETPAHTTHTAILDAADNETLTPVAIVSTETGAPEWTGSAYIAYDPLSAPTEGPVTITVTYAFANDPTRSAGA